VHIDPEDDEHESPKLPNCSEVEDEIRKIWSSHHDESALHAVTLHILSGGIEVVLRVSPEIDDSKFEAITKEISAMEGTSKVEFVSIR
jgi:hypothetical protein